MAKTIRLTDATYNRLSKFGSVGQSFGDVLEELMDFAEAYEKEYEEFTEEEDEEEE